MYSLAAKCVHLPEILKPLSQALRLESCIFSSLVVTMDTSGHIISHHIDLRHVDWGPRIGAIASGLKQVISEGPVRTKSPYFLCASCSQMHC
jgi:hypothetical protein